MMFPAILGLMGGSGAVAGALSGGGAAGLMKGLMSGGGGLMGALSSLLGAPGGKGGEDAMTPLLMKEVESLLKDSVKSLKPEE
ncbi:MAG: hypothetical protein ACR2QF_09475 [Geminicoccaceae bacterium]